jgi:hypothetical protein
MSQCRAPNCASKDFEGCQIRENSGTCSIKGTVPGVASASAICHPKSISDSWSIDATKCVGEDQFECEENKGCAWTMGNDLKKKCELASSAPIGAKIGGICAYTGADAGTEGPGAEKFTACSGVVDVYNSTACDENENDCTYTHPNYSCGDKLYTQKNGKYDLIDPDTFGCDRTNCEYRAEKKVLEPGECVRNDGQGGDACSGFSIERCHNDVVCSWKPNDEGYCGYSRYIEYQLNELNNPKEGVDEISKLETITNDVCLSIQNPGREECELKGCIWDIYGDRTVKNPYNTRGDMADALPHYYDISTSGLCVKPITDNCMDYFCSRHSGVVEAEVNYHRPDGKCKATSGQTNGCEATNTEIVGTKTPGLITYLPQNFPTGENNAYISRIDWNTGTETDETTKITSLNNLLGTMYNQNQNSTDLRKDPQTLFQGIYKDNCEYNMNYPSSENENEYQYGYKTYDYDSDLCIDGEMNVGDMCSGKSFYHKNMNSGTYSGSGRCEEKQFIVGDDVEDSVLQARFPNALPRYTNVTDINDKRMYNISSHGLTIPEHGGVDALLTGGTAKNFDQTDYERAKKNIECRIKFYDIVKDLKNKISNWNSTDDDEGGYVAADNTSPYGDTTNDYPTTAPGVGKLINDLVLQYPASGTYPEIGTGLTELLSSVTVTEADTTACTLAPSTDFGATAGTCADDDSAAATCAYVAGTYSGDPLDTIETADSCTSTTVLFFHKYIVSLSNQLRSELIQENEYKHSVARYLASFVRHQDTPRSLDCVYNPFMHEYVQYEGVEDEYYQYLAEELPVNGSLETISTISDFLGTGTNKEPTIETTLKVKDMIYKKGNAVVTLQLYDKPGVDGIQISVDDDYNASQTDYAGETDFITKHPYQGGPNSTSDLNSIYENFFQATNMIVEGTQKLYVGGMLEFEITEVEPGCFNYDPENRGKCQKHITLEGDDGEYKVFIPLQTTTASDDHGTAEWRVKEVRFKDVPMEIYFQGDIDGLFKVNDLISITELPGSSNTGGGSIVNLFNQNNVYDTDKYYQKVSGVDIVNNKITVENAIRRGPYFEGRELLEKQYHADALSCVTDPNYGTNAGNLVHTTVTESYCDFKELYEYCSGLESCIGPLCELGTTGYSDGQVSSNAGGVCIPKLSEIDITVEYATGGNANGLGTSTDKVRCNEKIEIDVPLQVTKCPVKGSGGDRALQYEDMIRETAAAIAYFSKEGGDFYNITTLGDFASVPLDQLKKENSLKNWRVKYISKTTDAIEMVVKEGIIEEHKYTPPQPASDSGTETHQIKIKHGSGINEVNEIYILSFRPPYIYDYLSDTPVTEVTDKFDINVGIFAKKDLTNPLPGTCDEAAGTYGVWTETAAAVTDTDETCTASDPATDCSTDYIAGDVGTPSTTCPTDCTFTNAVSASPAVGTCTTTAIDGSTLTTKEDCEAVFVAVVPDTHAICRSVADATACAADPNCSWNGSKMTNKEQCDYNNGVWENYECFPMIAAAAKQNIRASDLCERTGFNFDEKTNVCKKELDVESSTDYCTKKTTPPGQGENEEKVTWDAYNGGPTAVSEKYPCSVCGWKNDTKTCEALPRKNCTLLNKDECGSLIHRPGTTSVPSACEYYNHNMEPNEQDIRQSDFECSASSDVSSTNSTCSTYQTLETCDPQQAGLGDAGETGCEWQCPLAYGADHPGYTVTHQNEGMSLQKTILGEITRENYYSPNSISVECSPGYEVTNPNDTSLPKAQCVGNSDDSTVGNHSEILGFVGCVKKLKCQNSEFTPEILQIMFSNDSSSVPSEFLTFNELDQGKFPDVNGNFRCPLPSRIINDPDEKDGWLEEDCCTNIGLCTNNDIGIDVICPEEQVIKMTYYEGNPTLSPHQGTTPEECCETPPVPTITIPLDADYDQLMVDESKFKEDFITDIVGILNNSDDITVTITRDMIDIVAIDSGSIVVTFKINRERETGNVVLKEQLQKTLRSGIAFKELSVVTKGDANFQEYDPAKQHDHYSKTFGIGVSNEELIISIIITISLCFLCLVVMGMLMK